ncbi:MAG: TRAP transporter substrate-binding protein [Proteobacteria bacterium]|jgi:tripartite ATP-independent transporter DctP family solute receptor|nr:TRAP transporter substrate-binding protein [Pseudomonadota bacterium]MDA1136929.1 TRAP transporter substrate-binding protein [Pseudomonadota bacterium]|tara:strand:- start:244 stop:1197 length:954 start_codon:yes stop_codon:yes gene_type:complete
MKTLNKIKNTTKNPFKIILGGYGPPNTSFSKALKFIGEQITSQLGQDVDVEYVFNVMDLGYKSEDIIKLTEEGKLTISYQSSSYLTDAIPELGLIDLPFIFENNNQARRNMDGALGKYFNTKIEKKMNFKILGYFENGFRHISNRIKPIQKPEDLNNIKIRILPSDIHKRTFDLLGSTPLKMDLVEAIERIVNGTIDAQENPLANTVTYGVHKYHKYHTLSNHFYISRCIMCNLDQYLEWPEKIKNVVKKAIKDSVGFQRSEAEKETIISYNTLIKHGCEIIELNPQQSKKFRETVNPIYNEAKDLFKVDIFDLIKQ